MFNSELFEKNVRTVEKANDDIANAMGNICAMLNELFSSLPDEVYHADDDTTIISGFYVDEQNRLRYEEARS